MTLHHSDKTEGRRLRPEKRAAKSLPTAEPEVDGWMQLQSTIGNAAVGRLLTARERATGELPIPVAPEMQQQIDSQPEGRSLDAGLRPQMEAVLGAELPDVTLHTGSEADALARGLGATAFTQGRDVFLRSDRDPATEQGRETLAHELTHVAEGRALAGTVQRDVDPNQLKLEGGGILGMVGQGLEAAGGALAKTGIMGSPGGILQGVGDLAQQGGTALTMSGIGGMVGNMVGQAAQPQANPGMQAMWDAAVVDNVNGAISALSGGEPKPADAIAKLNQATHTMKSLAESYRSQGNPALADNIGVALNGLVAAKIGLEPYVGQKESLDTIVMLLSGRLDRLGSIRTQLV